MGLPSKIWHYKPTTEIIHNLFMSQYALFPIKNKELWDLYKKSVASFWTVEEVDLQQDKTDWLGLKAGEQAFIKNVLSFFAISDGIVNANLLMNFANEVDDSASLCFYGFQIAMENIHSEMYSLMIEAYVSDTDERMKLLNGIENSSSIAKKSEWCLKYTNHELPFQQRLVAFAIVEGIFFSASFCAIFWLKKRGKMPGLCFSNELISRDEGLHTTFACAKYATGLPIDTEVIHEMIRAAVAVEDFFVRESLQVDLLGMNADMMSKYVKYVADFLSVQLGCGKIFNTLNPFEWMTSISMQGKTNFFERRVSEYSKAGVGVAPEDNVFSLNVDF